MNYDIKKHLSYGNRKLPRTTAIFNITPAMQCPSDKLGLCQLSHICYAKQAEKQYPNCLPYRTRQTIVWDSTTPENFVQSIAKKTKYLRISEAGDFRSQSDVDKLSTIAELLKGRIKVYCYTARQDLSFDNVSTNLTVNGSGFMVHNNFIAVKVLNDSDTNCIGNCKKCNLCTTRKGLNIHVKIH